MNHWRSPSPHLYVHSDAASSSFLHGASFGFRALACPLTLLWQQKGEPCIMTCERRWALLIASLTVIASLFGNWVVVAVTCECRIVSRARSFHLFSALYIYDCLLTFPEEVSEIWPAKWSLTKIAYLLGRYGGMAPFVLEITSYFLVTDSARVSLPALRVCSDSRTADVR